GAVLVLHHVAIVDKTEIDDVDRDLRIVAGAHLFPRELLYVLGACVGWQLRRLDRFLADGVRILSGDAEQIALEVDGEAAAERLGDVARLARLDFHLLAGGNDHRAYLAVHDEGLILVPSHVRRYSVDTLAPSPSAAFNVCQQRLAHLTRAGNSRTPESAASLPSAVSGVTSGSVRRACTRANRACTSPRSLPLTASVMTEAGGGERG